jgi:hypothetical protein
VVFSTSGLYTFGKNEGQLGLVDSDARSLEVQTTPPVGTRVLNSHMTRKPRLRGSEEAQT